MTPEQMKNEGWIEIFTWKVTRNGITIYAKDKPFHFWVKPKK